MKKRYFAASLLALGVILGGCNSSPDCFKGYDLVMFTKVVPQSDSRHGFSNIEISECYSFIDLSSMQKHSAYGIAYYINKQDTPVIMSVKGKNIDKSITILPLASKGFVWKNASYQTDVNEENYIVTLTSDSSEMLNGDFTLGNFSDTDFDLSRKSDYNMTAVYSDFILSEENRFSTNIRITEEQSCGHATYINNQNSPITLSIKGKNVDRTLEIAPFKQDTLTWCNLDYDTQIYTVTIQCDNKHTLNGFLTLSRGDV